MHSFIDRHYCIKFWILHFYYGRGGKNDKIKKLLIASKISWYWFFFPINDFYFFPHNPNHPYKPIKKIDLTIKTQSFCNVIVIWFEDHNWMWLDEHLWEKYNTIEIHIQGAQQLCCWGLLSFWIIKSSFHNLDPSLTTKTLKLRLCCARRLPSSH